MHHLQHIYKTIVCRLTHMNQIKINKLMPFCYDMVTTDNRILSNAILEELQGIICIRNDAYHQHLHLVGIQHH